MATYLGSPVQLCCGEGGTLPAHITGVCGPCSQCLGHTSVCLPRSRRVCFPGVHCSGPGLLCRGTVQSRPWVLCASQVSAAQVHVLWRSTKGQTRWGLRFVPFPGLSRWGDQVLGECTLARWAVRLITSPVPGPSHSFPPPGAAGAPPPVCRVPPLGGWSLTVTLLADVSHPGSPRLATGGLLTVRWRMPSLGPRLPLAFRPACFSASGGGWAGPQLASSPLVFAQSFFLWVGPAVPEVRAFFGKVLSLSLPLSFFFSLTTPQFALLSPAGSLRLSSGHSGLVVSLSCWLPQIALRAFRPGRFSKRSNLCLPVQLPLAGGWRERLGYFFAGSCG